MRGFCPHCETERDLQAVSKTETFVVRGDKIQVPVEYLKCLECGNTFDDPRSPQDPVDQAYREYRRRHSLLQPEEIRAFRSSLGLTQRELALVLGWGGATLSRYENGALQDEAHDKQLRLSMQPQNLLMLLQTNPASIPAPKSSALVQHLKQELQSTRLSITALCEQLASGHEIDEFSGFVQFSIDKLNSAILFFSSEAGVFKTKLNKLLFYADFAHYRDFTRSITGTRYAHLPYGPAPDHYELFLAALIDERGSLNVEERDFPEFSGELLIAAHPADTSTFSSSELRTMSDVMDRFVDLSASRLSRLSHKEKGYVETQKGELISYEYAKALSIYTEPKPKGPGS